MIKLLWNTKGKVVKYKNNESAPCFEITEVYLILL